MEKIYRYFAEIVGKDNFFTNQAHIAEYSICVDYTGKSVPHLPAAVIRPRHKSQFAKIFEICAGNKIPVAIRGMGNSNSSAVNRPNTLLILTTGLDRIFDIDRKSRIIHLQAGIRCLDLARISARHGLHFPYGALSGCSGTIGGAIAMNMGESLKFGPLSSHVMRLGIFATNGRHFDFFSASGVPGRFGSGLSMAPVFCGSQGHLGLIDEIYLRLPPLAENISTACFVCANAAVADKALSAIMEKSIEPEFLELYDSLCAHEILDEKLEHDAILIICGIGVSQASRMAEMAVQAGARIAQADEESVKERCRGMLAAIYATGLRFRIEHIAFPLARLKAFLDAIYALDIKYSTQLGFFGNAGSANFSVLVPIEHCSSICREIFALELMLTDAMTDESDAEKEREAWQAARKKGNSIYGCIRSQMDPDGLLPSSDGI